MPNLYPTKVEQIANKLSTYLSILFVFSHFSIISYNTFKYSSVIPVNPFAVGEIIHGEEVFSKLEDIKIPIDIVNIFRPSNETPDLANEAVKINAKVLWLQLGIRDEESKKLMDKNNIDYIENKCTKMEYQKFFLKKRQAFPVLSN